MNALASDVIGIFDNFNVTEKKTLDVEVMKTILNYTFIPKSTQRERQTDRQRKREREREMYKEDSEQVNALRTSKKKVKFNCRCFQAKLVKLKVVAEDTYPILERQSCKHLTSRFEIHSNGSHPESNSISPSANNNRSKCLCIP